MRPQEENKVIRVAMAITGEEELAAVRAALSRGYYGLAEKVLEFESILESYLGDGNVVAVNTGTSALHIALDSIGVGPGDEVIVPSLTFVACFQAISATGAKPVPCDIHPDTLLMDVDDVKRKINEKTKALMPVHYAGNPCDMDTIHEIAKQNNIRVIEDAAHAFGSYYKGRKIGGFGDITCFSFDSIKNITCGEGGAVVCREESLADLMKQKRLLGIDRKSHTASWRDRKWHFDVKTQGYRYHMSNINAAIGIEQFKKLEDFIRRRQDICRKYDTAFHDIDETCSLEIDYGHVAPHIYVIRVKNDRDELIEYLKEHGIETGINYVPSHLQSFYKSSEYELPETEAAYREILTLPLHCGLSDGDVEYITGKVRDFFENK
jgi:dTDP-4-amino-4,6-dideoxygalactose transaminase